MDDEAEIRLVDAHAEGVGGDDHPDVPRHEALLVPGAFPRAQPAVVASYLEPQAVEMLGDLLAVLDGGDVDDALPFHLPEEAAETLPLRLVPGSRDHLQAQVLAIDADVDHHDLLAAELMADVLHHLGRRGGRERQNRRVAEDRQSLPQRQVGRAKVMSPLGDAVRLVDHEDGDLVAAQRLQELRLGEALRGDEDEIPLLLLNPLQHLGLLARGQRAVDLNGVQPDFLQLVHLVLHERDERRDDHGRSRQLRAGKLIAERFAGAGGHDGQGVLARQDRADDLLLPLAKRLESKGSAQSAPESRELNGFCHASPFLGKPERLRASTVPWS